MVLLQQADLYEVTRIIRACGRISSKKVCWRSQVKNKCLNAILSLSAHTSRTPCLCIPISYLLQAVVVSLPPGESYFASGAQELVTHTVDLSKAIVKRLKEIDDFTLKRRFEDASTHLRTSILHVRLSRIIFGEDFPFHIFNYCDASQKLMSS